MEFCEITNLCVCAVCIVDEQMTSVFGYSFFLAKIVVVLGFLGGGLICYTKKQHFFLRLKNLLTYGDPTCVYFLPACGDILNVPKSMVWKP